jgi:ribosomal protein S18 acetylase RimI-like enzyme
VHEDFQGKKVGQFLLDKAIEIGKENQFKHIWLGVWEKNFTALAFYTKNNFKKIAVHPFTLGNEKQTDDIMSLNLY